MGTIRRTYAVVGMLGAASALQCTETKQLGGLSLAITTDVAAPKDLDSIRLYVLANGITVFSTAGEVTPTGAVRFPATITLQEPKDPATIFNIRVVGYKGGQARVLRSVTTKVPERQFRQLRIPLSFLSYGSANGSGDLATKALPTRCDIEQGETDVAGICTKLVFFDMEKLEKFDERTVFGSGSAPVFNPDDGGVSRQSDGNCFNVAKCFAAATPLMPDGQCRVRNLGPRMNIGLSTENIGVPTDNYRNIVVFDMDAESQFGEVRPELVDNAAFFQLPKIVCDRMKTPGPEQITEIYGSIQCAPKSRNVPLCGPASATQTELPAENVTIGADGGVVTIPDGGVVPPPPPIVTMDSNLQLPRTMVSFEDKVYVGTATGSVRDVSVVNGVTAIAAIFKSGAFPVAGLAPVVRGGVKYLTGVVAPNAGLNYYNSVRLDGVPVVGQDILFYNTTALPLVLADTAALNEFNLFALTEGDNAYVASDSGSGIANTPPFYVQFGKTRFTSIGSYNGDVLLGFGRGVSPQLNGSIVRCAGRECRDRDPGRSPTIVAPRAPNGSLVSMITVGTKLFYLWAPNDGGANGALSVWNGATSTDLATGLTVPKVAGIASDGKNVYYASNDVVYAVPTAGGTPVRIAPVSGSYPAAVGRVVVTTTDVYWVTGPETNSGTVYRRALE
jgi:hypothetical protein